jgi:HJR/Mrr/RecB family endonuclease
MRRYSKRRYKNNDDDELLRIITGFVILYIVCLIFNYNSNPVIFWKLLIGGIFFVIVLIFGFIFFKKYKEKFRKERVAKIIRAIQLAGLEDDIDAFITRFGLGQEKDKNSWVKGNYKISWNRINYLGDILRQKGINFSGSEICILLSNYIDKREFDLTSKSITISNNNFSKLSGSDFEKLLDRLYKSMGYSVQLNGKTGDQGCDLIAMKDQERIVIQAKCYNNWNVGNSAIQEVAAAKSHYDCNKAIVITTSGFTSEAMALAKTNNVELISKHLLQKMLLDNLKESWS